MTSDMIGFKDGREIEWIELNLLKNNRPLSKSELTSISGCDETDVDGWLTEIELRSRLLTRPFYKVDNNRIIPNSSWTDIPEYFLCLYYSFNGANDRSGGTKLFELISANALKSFINGEVYALGFPAGKGFNEYLDEIAKICYEIRSLPADKDYNDDRVDVVGYKLFNDMRGANLYVLQQCAAGKHWTEKKMISLPRWTNYILWYPYNIIQSISTVEYVGKKDWDKRTSDYGMLMDRVRIYNCLYSNTVDPELRKDVLDWCQKKIDEGI